MAVYDFFLSRNNGVIGSNYVGHVGRLFYDSTDGLFRLSDGVTPGGTIVANLALAKVSETEPVNPQAGELWLNPTTFELWAYHDGEFIPTIDTATEDKIGGIKLGPGVTTNSEGQLIIDTAGLEFSFGDFGSIIGEYTDETPYALLQTVNDNEDAVIASNGTGKVAIVGEFTVHATDGSVTGSLESEPVFKVSNDGQISILVPDTDTNFGAVEIIGSTTNEVVAPGQPGTMLHLTGQADVQCRVYIDGNGDYASIVGRRWNGTIAGGRTQVLANDDVLRINATAQTNTELPGQAIAQIAFTALENQTATAQGSEIGFTVTPLGQPTANRVKVLKVDGVGVTTDRLVTARNYAGQARNAGTLGAAGTLTIDFATDHMVLVNLTTTATIAFSNITAGKTVTVLVKNATGQNRAVTLGVVAGNTTGGNAAPNVNDGRTGVFVYRTFGTATTDVYCEVN